jgi:hypothetical protein
MRANCLLVTILPEPTADGDRGLTSKFNGNKIRTLAGVPGGKNKLSGWQQNPNIGGAYPVGNAFNPCLTGQKPPHNLRQVKNDGNKFRTSVSARFADGNKIRTFVLLGWEEGKRLSDGNKIRTSGPGQVASACVVKLDK